MREKLLPSLVTLMSIGFLLLLTFPTNANACVRWSKGSDSFDELINQTNQIVLARFSCDDQRIPRCGFKVVEYLKNVVDPMVTTRQEWAAISAWLRIANDPMESVTTNESSDFNAHTDPKFWFREVQRAKRGARECHAEFSFEANKEYLVFVDSIGSRYAAEKIEKPDDAWLTYVKRRLEMKRPDAESSQPGCPSYGSTFANLTTDPAVKMTGPLNVDAIERDNMVEVRGAAESLPFGYRNAHWLAFKALMAPDDKVFFIERRYGQDRDGFILVRHECVVRFWRRYDE